MTERLYYDDCYLNRFPARVVETTDDGRRVYLDRTAFYPESGGQPSDLGTLGSVAVLDAVDEGERIAHVLSAPLGAGDVEGVVDWSRRFDHMQQHTGQHLLSAVLAELFEIPTVGFHMGALTSTVDLDCAVPGSRGLDQERMARAEERCAEIVREARPVTVKYADAASDLGLRKASMRTGTLRIIEIEGIDRSACGGTHLRSTAEIGPILLRKTEKIRRQVRVEFVCGLRALQVARGDFETLAEIARGLSAPPEHAPALVAAQIEKNKALEKSCQRLGIELAQRDGRELWATTLPDASGLRRVTSRGTIDEATRVRAQAFVAGSKALFLAVCENPPSLLLAASADSGVHAGERVKAAVAAAGGRGGGSQSLAQGSVPSAQALADIIERILAGF
jgi:alanyl-tRNA synthetase